MTDIKEDGFTFILGGAIPSDCFFSGEQMIASFSSGPISIEVWALSDRTITLFVAKDGRQTDGLLAGKVETIGRSPWKLNIAVSLTAGGKIYGAAINGVFIRDGESTTITCESMGDAEFELSYEPTSSDEVKKKRDRRRSEILEEGTEQAIFEGYLREIRLLKGYLEKLEQGDRDQVAPISVSLRKLLWRTRGNHLLLDYAALKGCPTMVTFTWPDCNPPPLVDGVAGRALFMEGSGVEVAGCIEDVLRQPVVFDGSRIHDLASVMNEIAGQIGAHLDPQLREVVEIVHGFNFADDQNYLVNFLASIAYLVLKLDETQLST